MISERLWSYSWGHCEDSNYFQFYFARRLSGGTEQALSAHAKILFRASCAEGTLRFARGRRNSSVCCTSWIPIFSMTATPSSKNSAPWTAPSRPAPAYHIRYLSDCPSIGLSSLLDCGPHRADTHGMPRPCQLLSQSLMDRLSLLPHIRLITSAFDPLNAKVLMRLSLNSL